MDTDTSPTDIDSYGQWVTRGGVRKFVLHPGKVLILPRAVRRQFCGTSRGYHAHRQHGEQTCEPCRIAAAERDRIARAARGVEYSPIVLQPCGTTGAYKRHKRNREEACDACKEAARVEQAERVARKAARVDLDEERAS